MVERKLLLEPLLVKISGYPSQSICPLVINKKMLDSTQLL